MMSGDEHYGDDITSGVDVADEPDEPDKPTIWDLLDEDAPAGCTAVQDLYSWSLNYEAGKGPFLLFLDIIGWSEENLGEPQFTMKEAALGYVEVDKLARALVEYVEKPHDVTAYAGRLIAAEGR